MNVRAALIATIAVAMGCGCAATQEAGAPFSAAARRQLVLERTTPAQVREILGKPVTITAGPDGRERWTYEYTRVSALRAVPFGRRVTVRQTPYERLVLTFRDGRLSECAYAVERYRTEGDLIVPAGSARESCGQPAR